MPADCTCLPPACDCSYTGTDLTCDTSFDSHAGLGILAGDFIKPDPALTQRENRAYILTELDRWLTGRICGHAKEISVTGTPADLATHLREGTWPSARLFAVLQTLENDNNILLPTNYEERFYHVGKWASVVCADYLNGYEPVIPAAVLAAGFVTTDLLPGGRTIESYWDLSPFEALRSAPPLTIDDQLDGVTAFYYKVLTSDITIRVPVWTLFAAAGGIAAYLATIVVGR